MFSLLNFLFPAKDAEERKQQVFVTSINLKKQIPLLYAVAVVNIIGMHMATDGVELSITSPITVLSAILVWRMIYWIFFQKTPDDYNLIVKELLQMVFFTALLCLGFSIWAQYLITVHPDKTMVVLFYSILAALGCAYGLGSFPRAAVVPLLILGLPAAGRLLIGDATHTGIGVSLFLVLLLFMRLLYVHSGALADQISGRIALQREHRRATQAELIARRRADEDGLTGLVNRGRLVSEIERTLVIGDSMVRGSALALIDLDGFKPANDTFGHAAGDAILCHFGHALTEEFGADALIARMGGDEFAIYWPHGLGTGALAESGERICELAATPVEWKGKRLIVTASCGITEAGSLTSSKEEFIRQADSALYKVKESRRGAWRLYDENAHKWDTRKTAIEQGLLSKGEVENLSVSFQPIFCARTGRIVFGEALARWQSDHLGAIEPSEFIEAAEQLGVIGELNDALMRKSLRAARNWPSETGLSFNLSALQVSRRGAAEHLLRLLAEEGFSRTRMQFEVTETALLADLSVAKQEMDVLSRAGCTIALDDFGAGHASVTYLRELPFDVVKLDGSLVRDIQHCSRSRGLLVGLVNLCHSLGTPCVAEHVENAWQYTLATEMGCDFVQGFYCGMPVSAEQFQVSLAHSRSPEPIGSTILT
jgi:diguanylate cyclase (GGDEF)-like protein